MTRKFETANKKKPWNPLHNWSTSKKLEVTNYRRYDFNTIIQSRGPRQLQVSLANGLWCCCCHVHIWYVQHRIGNLKHKLLRLPNMGHKCIPPSIRKTINFTSASESRGTWCEIKLNPLSLGAGRGPAQGRAVSNPGWPHKSSKLQHAEEIAAEYAMN